MVKHTATSVVTIERFIIEQERLHPEATGELSGILYDLALAAKMIANKVRSAGLADILGSAEQENVQGEVQQKLDVFANETIIKALDHGGRLCAMASEEEPDIIPIPESFKCGKYVLLFDPLDGSSNIDVNVPGRHDLLRGTQDHAWCAWRDGGSAAAGPSAGGRGLRDLRIQHDARVHDGAGRARLHARSVDRRVPAFTSRTSRPRSAAATCRSTTRTRTTGPSR